MHLTTSPLDWYVARAAGLAAYLLISLAAGLGMTMAEVRALWGEPADTEQEEPGEGGRSELWSYGNTRSVRFDHKGRVSAIQQ